VNEDASFDGEEKTEPDSAGGKYQHIEDAENFSQKLLWGSYLPCKGTSIDIS
jgi:hypothetical protein